MNVCWDNIRTAKDTGRELTGIPTEAYIQVIGLMTRKWVMALSPGLMETDTR